MKVKKNRNQLSFFSGARFLAGLLLVLSLAACAPARPVMGGVGRDPYVAPDTAGNTAEESGITICVDPGHGFEDIGTDSELLGTFSEKDITLAIALSLRDFLEEKGFQIVLTHDGQSFPKTDIDDGNRLFNPKERISYVQTLKIDYFLSIHCDSYEADDSVQGTRVYYSAGTDFVKKSGQAANLIQSSINQKFPLSKKAVVREMEYDGAYYVIRTAPVPASLIEVGFVTNPTDAQNMLDEDWRTDMAAAIADGISRFFAD